MPQHAYLEHGLTVLETRLKIPQPPGQVGRALEARPFITLGHETGAGATTTGHSAARAQPVSRLSANPPASFAIVLADAGAIR